MNNFSALDSRNRRNLLAHSLNAFSPPFHKNYSTDTSADMKTSYGDSLFINTVHLIPEPMKMNLADSVVTLNEKKLKTNMAAETKVNNNFNMKNPQNAKSDYYPSLAGITNFFTGVFNVMGAMFQKRANSPVQYYDCYEQGFEDHHQMTPSSPAWPSAKREDQNINGRAQTDEFANETYTDFCTDMSNDFRSIAAQCEDKLSKVRLLLNTSTHNQQVQKPARPRRPKRAFHEAGSVEELFEDAFNPEDLISLANETFLEYCSPFNHHHEDFQTVDAPKVKTNTVSNVKESMEIVESMPLSESEEVKIKTPVDKCEDSVDDSTKKQVVSSCEDKVSKLKALLQSRRAKKSNLNETKCNTPTSAVGAPVTSPLSIPSQPDTHTEVIFAKDIELPATPESPCVLDPSSYFDEVTGRFYSSSATESEDSFQIVFSDSPQNRRKRLASDCESEDSFIVFEESPDSCYTSNDVFGDDTNDGTNVSDSEDSDSDCESDLDSGVGAITLSHSLTRTFGDLTETSLYEDSKSEDVVDCAFRSGAEIPGELIDAERAVDTDTGDHSEDGATKKGLLLDEARKREKKKLPKKKVQFSPDPPKVHVMRVWAFAARQARAGHWERHALDRERFRRRIADVEMAVSWVLKPQHRSRVMFQRFMPWWHAQRRKELADKKQKEVEEKLKREEEAEKLALAKEQESSSGNDSSDTTAVDDKQVNNLRDKEELGGGVQNMQENTEVRVEDNRNKIVDNVNCKLDSVVNSGSVVKSDDRVASSAQTVESTEANKTGMYDETATISDNKVAISGLGKEKLCNGYKTVNGRVDNAIEDIKGHSAILNKKSIRHPLLGNTDRDTDHFVKDDRDVKNGVKLENNLLESKCKVQAS